MSLDSASATAPTAWWRVDADVLIAAALELELELESEKRRIEAEQGEMLAELDRRGIREATGYGSLRGLIGDCFHVGTVEAKAPAERATALNPSREFAGQEKPAVAPLTAAAAAEGAIGAGQIDAIIHALAKIPDTVPEEDRVKGEGILVDLARHAGPREINQAGARLLAQLDPDGREPKDEDPAEPHRSLTLTTRKDGSHHIKGVLDDETFARLSADLAPLAKRRPANDIDGRDLRFDDERLGDAFATYIRMLTNSPELPSQVGDSTHILVTMTYDQLVSGLGTAYLEGVGPISASHARILGCDAGVIPAVLGSAGQPLDVGRKQRLATKAQRLALVIRDAGCSFPGCDVEPQHCTPHHIVFWAHHGETKIDNLVLLCHRHHRLIHLSEWKVRMNKDGLPEFIPPKSFDPKQKPRRNTMHQQI